MRNEDVCESGGKVLRVLNMQPKWVASRPSRFTPQKSPWYVLDRRLGESNSSAYTLTGL